MADGPRAVPPVQPAEYTDSHLGLTIKQSPRTLKVLQVLESELDAITSIGISIHLTFFGISFGSLVSFSVVLGTVNPLPNWFAGMVWVSALASSYFGILCIRDFRLARRKISDLKRGEN